MSLKLINSETTADMQSSLSRSEHLSYFYRLCHGSIVLPNSGAPPLLFPVTLLLREQIRLPRVISVMGSVVVVVVGAAGRWTLIRLIIPLHRTLTSAING